MNFTTILNSFWAKPMKNYWYFLYEATNNNNNIEPNKYY